MIARAVCWTLVHSLWQGMLAALLAGIVVLCTRKSRPAVRHHLFLAILMLFLAVSGVTFSWQFRQAAGLPGAVHGAGWTLAAGPSSPARPGYDPPIAPSSNILQRIDEAVNEHAAAVSLLWMSFLFLQLIRMGTGLYRVDRIRRHGIVPSTAAWMEKLKAMAAQLGIKRKIGLLESGSVRMPAVIGFLKPAILLPFGMLANLPADQVESILLHELAHIKRNDLLTNLLLHLTEIVFFFNPGLRWLCSLIRREREACCDDIVLERTPDIAIYFEALVAFQQHAARGRTFSLRLAGGRNDLLWRMKRMLSEENKKLQLMEKTFLSFGLVALAATGLLGMKTDDKQTPKTADVVRVTATPRIGAAPDTSVKPAASTGKKKEFPYIRTSEDKKGTKHLFTLEATDEDGNKYFMEKINDKVTKISVNGKVVSQEVYDRYLYLFDDIETEWHEATRPTEAVIAYVPARPQPSPEVVESASVTVHGAGATPATHTMMADSVAVHRPNYDYFGHVIYDLLADGLIQSDETLSFTLDNVGFVLNGVKQTDPVYQKYKEKYVKSPEDHFIYSHDGGSTHSDIWVK
jgi:bla regulator protein BlaR1